jgi:DNA-directed RNA polymerase subunit RPC12/RpoP
MIAINIAELLEIYVAVFLAAIFVLWVTYKMVGKNSKTHCHCLRCSLCGMPFEDHSPTLLPRCPRCGSLNERSNFMTKKYY